MQQLLVLQLLTRPSLNVMFAKHGIRLNED